MSDKVIHISESTFPEVVLKHDAPVLVDFWSDGCGPCARLAPILEEAAGEHEGRLLVTKLNIEHNRPLAREHGVRRIPTLMLFKGGAVVATREGVPSRLQLNDFLAPYLEPGVSP